MSAFDFKTWMNTQLAQVENALSGWVGEHAPVELRDAMRYAVLDGGKRLRPLLVMASAQAVAHGKLLDEGFAMRAACAVELIHAYSLVHDDMPCMDNDLMRRGKPTVHVQYGEAMALLAGDALQALAFELLTPETNNAAEQARVCRELARAAGSQGMAGGQAIDLASVGKPLSEAQLRHMHMLKTGALLQGSVQMGAECAQSPLTPQARDGLARYGAAVGLAFQVVDDILDVTADSAALGKTAGKDAAADKPTYVSVMGLDASRALAAQLGDEAHQALAATGLADIELLRALADRVVNRSN